MGCCNKKAKVNQRVDKRGNYYDKYAFLTPKQLKRKKELEDSTTNTNTPTESN